MKNKLRKHNLLLGTWITLYNNNITEIIANSGFDWLAVDLEHSSLNLKEAEDIIRIISLHGIFPLVRLTSINNDLIKKVMDIGAKGLIIPNVCNIGDINKVVEFSHYPPKGKRSVGLSRANKHGNSFNDYYSWQKNNLVIIAQIENISSIENLDEIFGSNKIDAYFIGPYDLSASMNIPGDFNNKKFINVINLIKDKANKYNITHGIHVINPDINEIKSKIRQKYTFIACSLDTVIIKNKCEEIKDLKKISIL